MNDLFAIRATFSDYKRIKTRKVAQLIFEVPLEELHDTISNLGGEPSVNQDTWCGIARLDPKKIADEEVLAGKYIGKLDQEGNFVLDDMKPVKADASTREDEERNTKPCYTSATKPERERTLAEYVAMTTNRQDFFHYITNRDDYKIFLYEAPLYEHSKEETEADTAKISRDFVCWYCGVESRSEIKYDTPAQQKWAELYSSYREWLKGRNER